MRDLETMAYENELCAAREALRDFEFLDRHYRLEADRCAEHAAELREFIEAFRAGKPVQFPPGAAYARRYARIAWPEGRIVVAAPKHHIVITRKPKTATEEAAG